MVPVATAPGTLLGSRPPDRVPGAVATGTVVQTARRGGATQQYPSAARGTLEERDVSDRALPPADLAQKFIPKISGRDCAVFHEKQMKGFCGETVAQKSRCFLTQRVDLIL